MWLTREQVRHVAKLARLELALGDEARAQEDLTRILESFEALKAVETVGVEPTVEGRGPRAEGREKLRPDEVSGELGTEKALANAPQKHGTSFAVPKFLE